MARPKSDPSLIALRGGFRKNPARGKAAGRVKGKAAAPARRDYAGIMRAYIAGVLQGTVPACKWVRLAVERHVRDRERESEPGFAFRFDQRAASRFLAKAERYPHIKGKWARQRELVRLEPWQIFVLSMLFGWKRKRDNLRRFREAYIEVPRKNAKSTAAALVGLYMLMDDREHGAEVYCGAGTERQAHEVFQPAKLMLDRSPAIRDAAGVEIWAKALVVPDDNSKFWPVVGNPGDGASPSCAIIDEYHEHLTSDLADSMVSGMGARTQPLLLIITTAGTDMASPCRDKHLEVEKVLGNVAENDELFGIIFTIDEGEDWADPVAIRKANPNLGVSVDMEFLLAQQRQAVLNPSHQVRFKTKHLNVWCGASVAGINSHLWTLAADPGLTLKEFAGEKAWFSLDLASRLDICAFVQLFIRELNGSTHYYAFGRYYLPQDTIAEARANQLAYQKWMAQGHLIGTDGAEIDFDVIRDDVKDLASLFAVQEVTYDPWRATQLAHQLAKDGAAVVEMPQTARNMGDAFDELQSALKGGRLHHDGNPVLAWMASNVIAKTVAKGLVVPAKEKAEQKIDGIVAVVMAISRAMAASAPSNKPKFQAYAF